MRMVFPNANSGRLMDDLATDVGTLFESFLGDVAERGRGVSGRSGKPLRFAPAMDIDESEQAYRVSIDVPGVAQESIEIDVHEDTLTVAGSREAEAAAETVPLASSGEACCGGGGDSLGSHSSDIDSTESGCCSAPAASVWKRHRRERVFGAFERKVQLPLPVEADAVSAELADGVLTVTLPKADPDKGKRRIPVSRG